MDFPSHTEAMFTWLLTMARTPGWKAQAWHRAQELAASDGMYASFPKRLTQAMRDSGNTDARTEGSPEPKRVMPVRGAR
jgi:hypothetical protein